MSDLVERLKKRAAQLNTVIIVHYGDLDARLDRQAAAEIARLRAVNAELVEALEWALAELDGRTQYSADGQHERCLVAANYALSKAKGEA